jgi:hypothetical protein
VHVVDRSEAVKISGTAPAASSTPEADYSVILRREDAGDLPNRTRIVLLRWGFLAVRGSE